MEKAADGQVFSRESQMRIKSILLIVPLLFVLLLCGFDQYSWGYYPVSPMDNEPIWNVPDVDVPLYTLTLEDGKVVSDVDYVVNLDISGKEEIKILNFADLHLTEEVINEKPREYQAFLNELDCLVSEAEPDLITLTGDQVPSGGYGALKTLGEKINSYGVPWAPVFGNHDCDHGGEASLVKQAEIYESFSDCLFKRGPEGLNRVLETGADSIGNYVVNLVTIDGDDFTVVRSLIFMNTGSNEIYNASDYPGQRRYSDHNYACLNRNQIEWFKQMTRSVQQYGDNGYVPCGIIMHMASFGYVYASSAAIRVHADIYSGWNWIFRTKMISYWQSLGNFYWRVGYEDSYGVMHEDIMGSPYEEGLFFAMNESGCTDFIMVGHDHDNNFNIKYDGINFVYGMKTGPLSYGTAGRGGTVITISSDGKASFRNILKGY